MAAEVVHEIRVAIPRFFRPRSYQREFVHAMRAGAKRAALVWHRRAGKDLTVLNWTIEAMCQRVGLYFYFYPTYAQGKKALWDGIEQPIGRPFLANFPPELIDGEPNQTEMKITLKNGSIFQLVGADNIDSIVGTNPIGCAFSEFSLMNPKAWDLMRPILAENGGWAVFDFTPRGRNWGWKLWQSAIADHWFTSMKTVDDTRRDSEPEAAEAVGPLLPVVTPESIESERRSGMAPELIRQEFYCSWEGSSVGSYYGDQMEQMRKEGRVTAVEWDHSVEVDTSWDLGVDDETVIGFWQDSIDLRRGTKRLHLIDVLSGSKNGVEWYWKQMKEKPYTYGRHFGPHDLSVKEWGSGKTRLQSSWALGLNFEVQPKLSIEDYIQNVRKMLPFVWVDEERCGRWVDAMAAYRKEYNERTDTFRKQPLHDWTSHWADMTKYRATAFELPRPGQRYQSPSSRHNERPDTQAPYSVFKTPYETPNALRAWNRSKADFD